MTGHERIAIIREEIDRLKKHALDSSGTLAQFAGHCFYWHFNEKDEWYMEVQNHPSTTAMGRYALTMPETKVAIMNAGNKHDKRASIGKGMNLRDAMYMALTLWLNNCLRAELDILMHAEPHHPPDNGIAESETR